MKPTLAAVAVWQVYGRYTIGLSASWHWEWTAGPKGAPVRVLRLC